LLNIGSAISIIISKRAYNTNISKIKATRINLTYG
jgi:hypothetical protein